MEQELSQILLDNSGLELVLHMPKRHLKKLNAIKLCATILSDPAKLGNTEVGTCI